MKIRKFKIQEGQMNKKTDWKKVEKLTILQLATILNRKLWYKTLEYDYLKDLYEISHILLEKLKEKGEDKK